MDDGSGNLAATAKLLMSFVERVRTAAAHDMASEPDQNPIQRAYQVCLSKLSNEDRSDLVRVINKLARDDNAGAAGVMAHWRVDYLDNKGSHLGTVEAPDERSALEQATKLFHVTPARRNKIRVTPFQAAEKRDQDSSS